MSALALDTHAYIKKLEAAGFTEQQAEVLAETQANLLTNQLATKADIETVQRDMKELETRLVARINVLEERTDGRFKLLQWMLGFNLVLTGAVFWLLIRH
jgi:hypothetical protein